MLVADGRSGDVRVFSVKDFHWEKKKTEKGREEKKRVWVLTCV